MLLHLFKRRSFTVNRFFIILSLLLSLEFSIILFIHLKPEIASNIIIIKVLMFLPLFIFTLSSIIAFLYPLKNLSEMFFPCFMILMVALSDWFFLYLAPDTAFILENFSIPKNPYTITQLTLSLISILSPTAIFIMQSQKSSMNRIINNIMLYTYGIIFCYLLFIIIYFLGYRFQDSGILTNPFLIFPIGYIFITTSYLLMDLRNTDMEKFYKESIIIIINFLIYTIPSYLFLKFFPYLKVNPLVNAGIKSSVVFIWLVISYRTITPLTSYIRTKKQNRYIKNINDTLIPINELRKITDMDKFWDFVTKDNFQGLKNIFGIQSAYFMLYSRKNRGYEFTYGYGEGINPEFLPEDNIVVQRLSSYINIFEKSYLLTDAHLADARSEIEKFFTDNNLEGAILLRNINDSVMGFLFLGTIAGGRGYNLDIINSLEIFRIKLQSLLTTGLILDEITSDQIIEHDRLVIESIKSKIIPQEMPSIDGIRISSFFINNSSNGGEYIDGVKISKDRAVLFMADTLYNGIDSALNALQLYSIIHSRTITFNSAEKIMNTINQVLFTSKIGKIPTSAICITISPKGDFTLANASFTSPLIFDGELNSFSEIPSSGIPLGEDNRHKYILTSGRLKDDSIMIVYSRGLYFAKNQQNKTFPIQTIKDTVVKHRKFSPAIIAREIYNEITKFFDNTTLENDISLMVIKKVEIDG